MKALKGSVSNFESLMTLQGARLYVVSNSSSTVSKSSLEIEKWALYENDEPLRSWAPTASRTALGPFLAYRSALAQTSVRTVL